MSSSIAHPYPRIHLDTRPDPLLTIAVGLGSWRIQSKAQHGILTCPVLATMIVEEAAGFADITATERAALDGQYPAAYTTFTLTVAAIDGILRDLPGSVWERVVDELATCNPDRALRIIQMHANIVHQLTMSDLPAREPAADPSVVHLAS